MKTPRPTPDVSSDAKAYLRAGAFVSAALGVTFAAWAGFAKLDGAVLAPGKIAVEGSRKTVQATASGVVSELFVRDGDAVEAGQVLVRIDHTVSHAAHERARSRLDGLLAKQSRLDAEWTRRAEIRFPAELAERAARPAVAEAIAVERAHFEARAAARRAETRALEARIPKLEAARRGHRARGAAARIEISTMAADLEGARRLFEQGYLSRARLRALERDHARAIGEAALSRAEAEGADREIQEIRLTLERDATRQREEVVRALEAIRREMASARAELVETAQTLRRTAVEAPATGKVFGLAIHTEGAGVVREGDPLLQIVPDEAPLIVEARVPIHDVDRVSQGQSARVQLSAFDTDIVPPVSGTVVSISADRFEDPERAAGFYVARIRIDPDAFEALPGIELRAGMPAETWIRTGRKSALRYLMEPLTDGWSRALIDG